MRDTQHLFQTWLQHAHIADVAQDLYQLQMQGRDAIEDAFFDDLHFGTAGLRGILGAGTARMNEYTVGKATYALAKYLKAHIDAPHVVLCRDSRNKGEAFVKHAAAILAHEGIHVSIFPRIEPTPTLSFAVRFLHASAGINITASHNPAKYNGYKVYGSDGCQITEDAADEIASIMQDVHMFEDVRTMDFDAGIEQGLISWVADEVVAAYQEAVLEQVDMRLLKNIANFDTSSLQVLYTPLHGTGLECVSAVFDKLDFVRYDVVEQQAIADGDFPTCPTPNPELQEALHEALQKAQRTKPDIVVATDPDADRVALAVPDTQAADGYRILSGNEQGVLLMDYLARRVRDARTNVADKVAITTIVSSPMVDDIARRHGFELRRVLTGFKYIGEQIQLLEDAGREKDFLFGYEESYGYLSGTKVRDKDAIVAAALFTEMAYVYKQQKKTLLQALEDLYTQYGRHCAKTLSFTFEGAQGAMHMANLMRNLRTNTVQNIGEFRVERVLDYASGVHMPCTQSQNSEDGALAHVSQVLPSADVLEFDLGDIGKVIVRPSGTEPKIKAYVFAHADTVELAQARLDALCIACESMLS